MTGAANAGTETGSPASATGQAEDPLGAAAESIEELRIRGCIERSSEDRERLSEFLYARLHSVVATLGLLFAVVVLAQGAAETGTRLHTFLLVLTWILWATFAAEYALRMVIAPSKANFLRRTWWQLLFLAVPFLTMLRALFILRVGRPVRVALAAVRGGRSARATLTSRAGWLGVLTAIVAFASADVLHSSDAVRPYGAALHAALLATITGEPFHSDLAIAQVLDVVLAIYSVVFFATLAGILGAFFLEARNPMTDQSSKLRS